MTVTNLNFEPGNIKFDHDYNYKTYTQSGAITIGNTPIGLASYEPLNGFTLPFISDGSGVTWPTWCVDINGRETPDSLTTAGTYTIHGYWDHSQQVAVISIFGIQSETPTPIPPPLTGSDVVFINNTANTSVNGNTLTKDSGGTNWNAGAFNSFKVLANEAVEVIWRANSLNQGRMVCLCVSDANVGHQDKDYCQALGDNNTVTVWNKATNNHSATLNPAPIPGSYFRLSRATDGTISYAHSTDKTNWSTYYTEPSTDTQELFVAFLITTQGGSIDECEIS